MCMESLKKKIRKQLSQDSGTNLSNQEKSMQISMSHRKARKVALSKGRNHFSRATIQTGQTLTNYLDPFHQSH